MHMPCNREDQSSKVQDCRNCRLFMTAGEKVTQHTGQHACRSSMSIKPTVTQLCSELLNIMFRGICLSVLLSIKERYHEIMSHVCTYLYSCRWCFWAAFSRSSCAFSLAASSKRLRVASAASRLQKHMNVVYIDLHCKHVCRLLLDTRVN